MNSLYFILIKFGPKKIRFLFGRMTKEFSTVNNTIQIKKLLRVLSQEFAMSQNPHTRKGGLIGLAAMAIALGKVKF